MQSMTRFVGGLVVLLVATVAAAHNVEVLDDCAPNADWGVNGCLLDEGDVTRSEFNAELLSPLADAVIGHQAWRNDPSYLKIEFGDTVNVKNTGAETIPLLRWQTSAGEVFLPSTSAWIQLWSAPRCRTCLRVRASRSLD
jgi:hypothetical protein